MSERPYPNGMMWDEAWLQRQRADAAEDKLYRLGQRLEKFEELRRERDEAYRLLREACEVICHELQPSIGFDRFSIRREWREEAIRAMAEGAGAGSG